MVVHRALEKGQFPVQFPRIPQCHHISIFMSAITGIGIIELALERQYIPKGIGKESLCLKLQVILAGKWIERLLNRAAGNSGSLFVKRRVALINITYIKAIINQFGLFTPTFLLSDWLIKWLPKLA